MSLFTVLDCCVLLSALFLSVDTVSFITGRTVLFSKAIEVFFPTWDVCCEAVVSFSGKTKQQIYLSYFNNA